MKVREKYLDSQKLSYRVEVDNDTDRSLPPVSLSIHKYPFSFMGYLSRNEAKKLAEELMRAAK